MSRWSTEPSRSTGPAACCWWPRARASSPATRSPSTSSDDGGTAVTYTADLRLRGPLRLFDPVLQVLFNRIGDNARDGLAARLRPPRSVRLGQVSRPTRAADRPPLAERRRPGGGSRSSAPASPAWPPPTSCASAGHDVHVFEAERHAGGHANTVTRRDRRRAAGTSTPASSSSTTATTRTSTACSTSSGSPLSRPT